MEIKTEIKSFISEIKPHTLRKVPTLSLSSYTKGNEVERNEFISLLFSGIKDYGFVILKDHDVSADLLKKAY